jgi:uncharacterized membrane protein
VIKTAFRYLLVVFFILAGVNHFRSPDFYLTMMPPYFPAHEFLVMLSGITEIIAGIMLAIPKTAKAGAWFIIAHLVIFFTVHVYMLQEADGVFADVPLAFLWIRFPFQFLFIAWAFWFTRPDKDATEEAAPAEA